MHNTSHPKDAHEKRPPPCPTITDDYNQHNYGWGWPHRPKPKLLLIHHKKVPQMMQEGVSEICGHMHHQFLDTFLLQQSTVINQDTKSLPSEAHWRASAAMAWLVSKHWLSTIPLRKCTRMTVSTERKAEWQALSLHKHKAWKIPGLLTEEKCCNKKKERHKTQNFWRKCKVYHCVG